MSTQETLLLAAVAAALALILSGCTADGNFDGQAFGAAVNALDGTYKTYEEQKRLNQYPQYAQPVYAQP